MIYNNWLCHKYDDEQECLGCGSYCLKDEKTGDYYCPECDDIYEDEL